MTKEAPCGMPIAAKKAAKCRKICGIIWRFGENEGGMPCLNALFKGKKPVQERILKLDAERFLRGDLPLANLLAKYCSHLMHGK